MARCVPFLLLCLVAGSTVGGAASADGYDALELRLKTSGVGAPLARQISDSIRLGAENLIERYGGRRGSRRDPGTTSLVTLALLHTGERKAQDLALKLFARLRKKHWRNVEANTYSAAIGAMLLQTLEPKSKSLRDVARAFGKGVHRDGGYWGYRPGGSGGSGNLSTAQFACLGLWAAERAGWPRETAAWAAHGAALVENQLADGSWAYMPAGAASSYTEHTYSTGTCMGLADLVLAREKERPTKPAALRHWWASELAIRSGKAALERHTRWILDMPLLSSWTAHRYYQFYALEKVCIFLERDRAGGLRWYRRGAELLLDVQLGDGGWSKVFRPFHGAAAPIPGNRSDDTATAFALLFLLRASETYRPTTPRVLPLQKPRGPVTPDFDAPSPLPGVEEPVPGPTPAPLPLVRGMLDRLREVLPARLGPKAAPKITSMLRFLERATPDLVRAADAGDEEAAKLATSLARVLRDLVQPVVRGRLASAPWRVLIAIKALDLLGQLGARSEPAALLGTLRKVALTRKAIRKLPIGYFHAAFEMLRATLVDTRALEDVLIDEAISIDGELIPCTIPAILCLERIGASNPTRSRALAKRLMDQLRTLTSPGVRPMRLRDLQWDLVHALHVLAPDLGPIDKNVAADPGRVLAALRRKLK